MGEQETIKELLAKIQALERENAMLRRDFSDLKKGNTVHVPDEIKPLFDIAQKTVGEYFRDLKMDPTQGKIEISDQRYVLVRASALSNDFLNTFQKLYADRGEKEALTIGKNFLFDIAHVIGINDAKNFHHKMNLTDPIAKLSAGPVHFAYSGWAYVDILPESSPTPDENFYLLYNHPFSFEADSWIRSGKKSDTTVCVMNSGYSSGWCEESFGIPLTAVEVTCKAKGDEHCTFIMSPPDKIQEHVNKYFASTKYAVNNKISYDIPTFFERKKVEEEMLNARKKAEESERLKSEFLSNMSHEIRTPMNTIIGYVDLMLLEDVSESHREYLKILKDTGKLLLNLINNVLDISKIEAGELLIESTPHSIRGLLDSIESSMKGVMMEAGSVVQLKKIYADSLSEKIYIDATRFQLIMNNLVGNAIKFTHQGIIEFGLHLKDQTTLEFYVKDTGIGISKSDFKKIFEIFGQADGSNTRQYGGTGLGLTISKKLVELMGGEIRVESEKGEGACFYFTLPYRPVVENVQPTATKSPSDSLSDKHCLLLVEDNHINQRLTKMLLEKYGFEVITANNGQEAISTYEETTKIKLILMDLQMPILDGLSAAIAIREFEGKHKRNHTPIIAFTGRAMKGDKEKCFEAGFDDYISKPIITEVLLKKIRKHL